LRYTAEVAWQTLKKTPVHLHVKFGNESSNNLSAKNIQINPSTALMGIRIDLNDNLKKSATNFAKIDADELAAGKLSRLESVHISDGTVIKKLGELKLDSSTKWELIVELRGSNRFVVKPAITKGDLVLSVVPAKKMI
jgi:hypothetical protein